MSDPVNTSQPVNPSELVPNDRKRFQFSIRSLLFFTLIAALVTTSLLMYRRMSKAERELITLRNEAGYLKIEDEKLFQAIALDCPEPLTWKWRVFMPKGSKYSWNLASGDIPESSIPKNGFCLVSSFEQLPRTKGVEALIMVSIRKNPDPNNKRWDFTLFCRSTERDEKSSLATSISDELMDNILQAHCSETHAFGDLKPETSKRGETIILLKRRIGEQSSPNSWTTSTKPQSGFIIWLKEMK